MDIEITPATPLDLPRLMDIYLAAFASYPAEAALIGPDPNSPESRQRLAERHLHAWRLHGEEGFVTPVGIKATVSTQQSSPDPTTTAGTTSAAAAGNNAEEREIAGLAEWYIFDRPHTPDLTRFPFLLGGSWIEDETTRNSVRASLQHVVSARARIMGGRPHGVLMYLCVDERWRRKGVAKALVRWGLDRCAALGVPAYLEASEMGMPLYQGFGFERVGERLSDGSTALVWQPPGKGQVG